MVWTSCASQLQCHHLLVGWSEASLFFVFLLFCFIKKESSWEKGTQAIIVSQVLETLFGNFLTVKVWLMVCSLVSQCVMIENKLHGEKCLSFKNSSILELILKRV